MDFLPDDGTQQQGGAATASSQSFMFYAPFLDESSSFQDDQGCESEMFHRGSSTTQGRSGMSDADSFGSAPSLLFYAPYLSEDLSEPDLDGSRVSSLRFSFPSPPRRYPTSQTEETSPQRLARTPTLPKIPKPALRRPPPLAHVPFVRSCGSFEEEVEPPAAAPSHHSPVTSQQSPPTSQQSPTTSQQSPTTSNDSPVTSHHSPVTSYHSPAASHHSPVTSPPGRRKALAFIPIPPAVAESTSSRTPLVRNVSSPTNTSFPQTRIPFPRRWASLRQLVPLNSAPNSSSLTPLNPVRFLRPKVALSPSPSSSVPNRTAP
jgi:hypothetical protein